MAQGQLMQQLGALSLSPPKEYRAPVLKQARPAYMISGKGFFNAKDILVQTGQVTYHDGEPNLDMIPMNKLAHDKMGEFKDKLDAAGVKKAKADGKVYIPLVRSEWVDGESIDSIPMPSSVLGADKSQMSNDVIH